ncbi:MAG: methyltransferase domain-containing protein [Planctomycetota bacterium]
MPDIDVGTYHQDAELVKRLEEELYANHAPITLPPEYAEWVQDNLLRFLIRLARYKFVARLLSDNDRLLEVGCGSGLGAIFLAQHCAHVTGLDVKEYELEEARSMLRRDNVDFVRGDFFEFAPERPFDSIVALDVIEHMPPEAGDRLLARMASLLDPAGMVVIGTPSSHSYPHQSEISRASHVKCYDLPELQDLVAPHFARVLPFSMNDEIVHTGHPKMAWYYFLLCLAPTPQSETERANR